MSPRLPPQCTAAFGVKATPVSVSRVGSSTNPKLGAIESSRGAVDGFPPEVQAARSSSAHSGARSLEEIKAGSRAQADREERAGQVVAFRIAQPPHPHLEEG